MTRTIRSSSILMCMAASTQMATISGFSIPTPWSRNFHSQVVLKATTQRRNTQPPQEEIGGNSAIDVSGGIEMMEDEHNSLHWNLSPQWKRNNVAAADLPMPGRSTITNFQQKGLPFSFQSLFSDRPTGLFASGGDALAVPEDFDWDSWQQKNVSRLQYGLKPLSPTEFIKLQDDLKEMRLSESLKQSKYISEQRTERLQKTKELRDRQIKRQEKRQERKQRQQKGGFLNFLGNVLTDTCESNADCQRPEICCDFGFKKSCCSGGSLVGSTEMVLARIQPRAPPEEDPNPQYPKPPTPSDPYGRGPRQY